MRFAAGRPLAAERQRTHDVMAACCLAEADVWVQIPLGALRSRCGTAWFNPPGWGPGNRRFKSDHLDYPRCGVAGVPAWLGSRRTLVQVQPSRLRFTIQGSSMVEQTAVNRKVVGPTPTPEADSEGPADRRRPPARNGTRRKPLRVRLPPLPLHRVLGRVGEASGSHPDHAGSIPAGHSRGSANGRPAVFEIANEGSIPSPRTSRDGACPSDDN